MKGWFNHRCAAYCPLLGWIVGPYRRSMEWLGLDTLIFICGSSVGFAVGAWWHARFVDRVERKGGSWPWPPPPGPLQC